MADFPLGEKMKEKHSVLVRASFTISSLHNTATQLMARAMPINFNCTACLMKLL